MCKHTNITNSIEHFYNEGKYDPYVLDPKNPTVGLSNSSVTVSNNFLICKFTRVKKTSAVKHDFELDENFFILAACGSIQGEKSE